VRVHFLEYNNVPQFIRIVLLQKPGLSNGLVKNASIQCELRAGASSKFSVTCCLPKSCRYLGGPRIINDILVQNALEFHNDHAIVVRHSSMSSVQRAQQRHRERMLIDRLLIVAEKRKSRQKLEYIDGGWRWRAETQEADRLAVGTKRECGLRATILVRIRE
jgi:hypothetical protein